MMIQSEATATTPALPAVSIVVPTLNEAKNLPELARRVDAAMAGRSYELLIIDDRSTDDTPAVAAQLATTYPLRLHVRQVPKDGLSGAVLTGLAFARGDIFVVMDADLQHPPEKLPELISVLNRQEAEFALGSRFVPGGSTAEAWSVFRRINSWVATTLARPFAGKTRDPMSGFFALRRSTFERGKRLTPLGYKIGLELMCKCRVASVKEVPIHFDTRAAGASKLSLKQQFRYLEHLSRLYDFFYPRLSPAIKFFLASLLGWLVGFATYTLMLNFNASLLAAIAAAYASAIACTLVFHLRYVRTQREFLITHTPWRDFGVVAAGEWVAATATAGYIRLRSWPVGPGEMFVLCFAAATIARYILRKELMQDIRGLRREYRAEEFA